MKTTNPTMVQRMECWPLEKLQAYASNARIHPVEQVQQIAASMMEFGVVNPVLIGPDGTIIAGHARVTCRFRSRSLPRLYRRLTAAPASVLSCWNAVRSLDLVLETADIGLVGSVPCHAARGDLARRLCPYVKQPGRPPFWAFGRKSFSLPTYPLCAFAFSDARHQFEFGPLHHLRSADNFGRART